MKIFLWNPNEFDFFKSSAENIVNATLHKQEKQKTTPMANRLHALFHLILITLLGNYYCYSNTHLTRENWGMKKEDHMVAQD